MIQRSNREVICAILDLKSFIIQWAKHITPVCNHLVSRDTFLNSFQPDTLKGTPLLHVAKYMKVIDNSQ